MTYSAMARRHAAGPRARARDERAAGAAPATRARVRPPRMKIAQGWPKLWANVRALVGIFSQIVGPILAIWANPVQFSFGDLGCQRRSSAA
jgi:hypothetical protein